MRVTPKALVEMAMTEVANDRPGQAMIHLWLLRDMVNGITVELDTPVSAFERSALLREARASVALDSETYSLPPMRKLAGKPLKTKDVSCPTCKAKPNQLCFRMTGRGPNATPTTTPLFAPGSGKPMLHKTRTSKAQEGRA